MIVMGMRKLVDVIVWCHCRLSELRDVIVEHAQTDDDAGLEAG